MGARYRHQPGTGPVNSVSGDQFREILTGCKAAFRLEWQRDPLPFEQPGFDAWCDRKPRAPEDWPEWAAWLEFTKSLGERIIRVRLIDDPPTPYQEWGIWAIPYHAAAGDDIRLMPVTEAEELGIALGNWWFIVTQDDELLISVSEEGAMSLIDVPEVIDIHRAFRDLAFSRSETYAGAIQLTLYSVETTISLRAN